MQKLQSPVVLFAKRNRKQQADDDMNRWYEEVNDDASPDDVFWEEMERQRLMNQIGDSSESYPLSSPGTSSFVQNQQPMASLSSTSPVAQQNMMQTGVSTWTQPAPTQEDQKRAEATLSEYELFMVDDNWLDDDLLVQMMDQDEKNFLEQNLTLEEETQRLEKQLEAAIEEGAKKVNGGSLWEMMEADEPWDHWGDSEYDDPEKEGVLRVDPNKASEYLLDSGSRDDAEDDEERQRRDAEEAAQDEAEFWNRMSRCQTKSRRLQKAKSSDKAKEYFNREPDELQGYDQMWVSAIDNVCHKSLVGVFRNYGIQFADNFGDWEDGCPEDGLLSIEDMASFKARKVHEVTGLPCIASRTSFEIEPVPIEPEPMGSTAAAAVTSPRSSVGRGSPGVAKRNANPRVVSGYRINDIAMNVEYLCEALRPLSEPTRVTRFKTCLCYYDGQMEVFEYGICDVDIHFATSMRTLISMSLAINNMLKTLQLAFGLEYQSFLKTRLDDARAAGTRGGISSSPASIKLRDRILKDGKVLPNEIIDVSAFMDSMVDVNLMDECANELSQRFFDAKPSKILTVATTGLVIALPMAKYLQVPVVYARKERNVVMADTFQAGYSSKTVGKNRELLVSKSHIDPDDRILIIDDFLSSGASQEALLRIVSDAGATAVGVGVLLEKVYDSGRQSLSGFDVPIHSLCSVASVANGVIQVVEEDGYQKMFKK